MKKDTKKQNLLLVVVAVIAMAMFCYSHTLVQAAANDPYCYASYSNELGCDVVDYYDYDSLGYAELVPARRIIKDGNVLKTGRGDVIARNYKAGSNVSWYNTKLVAYQDTKNSVWVWNYQTEKSKKIADSANKILLNYDSFAASVVLKNGKTVSISSLVKSSGSGYGSGTESTSTTSNKEVITETNASTKRVTVTFGGNTIVSYRNEVTYNSKYKLSEYCKSGIRYLAVTQKDSSSYYIWVYEDDTATMYRFDTSDICNPIEVSFSGKLKSVTFDSKGYGDKVVTTTGSVSFSNLKEIVTSSVTNKVDNSAIYVINKRTYSTLYRSANVRLKLACDSNGNLTLLGSQIATGVSTSGKQFGFDENYVYYLVGNTEYRAPIYSPSYKSVVRSGVKKLTYSKINGFVTGAE